MPIYDYECNDCGEISELLLLNSEEGTLKCTQCGGTDMRRVFSSSYSIRIGVPATRTTCCGRDEQCETPACSTGRSCRKDG